MQNFDEWNEVKKNVQIKTSEIVIDEGDIRWCIFGLNYWK
jgi:hypothetical protein